MAKFKTPEAVIRRIEAIIKRYAWLDDAAAIISADPMKVRRAINDFSFEMRIVSEVRNKDDLVVEAQKYQKEIIDDLAQYDLALQAASVKRAERAIRAVVIEQSSIAKGIINGLRGNLSAKQENLIIQAISISMPSQNVADAADRRFKRVNFTADGKSWSVKEVELNDIWADLTKRYGTTSTITYRNGANYPLTTYLDGKIATTNREVQNTVSSIEAAANSIYTGIIDAYGSDDSCRLWEGAVVFYTDHARKEFLKLYRTQYPEARKWKSIAEIGRDKTHMFGFNCGHRVSPLPLGLIPREHFEDVQFRSPKIPKTPYGIKQATAREVAA